MTPAKNRRTKAPNGRDATADHQGGSPGRRPASRRAARRSRRALRREVPSTVALLTGGDDFAAMRRYATFAFDDHTQYLHRMQELLRSLAAESLHVSVTRFDPAAYADYCAASGQDPDSPASRARYSVEVAAAKVAVRYHGQPMAHLTTQLRTEAERQADWEYATEVLAGAAPRSERAGNAPTGSGAEPDAGADAAFERASQAVMRLVESLGPGLHHIVCSVPVNGTSLTGVLHLETDEGGTVRLAEADVLAFCTILAAGIATGSRGGIVLRTCAAPGSASQGTGQPDRIRGWSLRDGWLHPLTEAEVFNAHCTDATTGDPIPPEPGLAFGPGILLPLPGDDPRQR